MASRLTLTLRDPSLFTCDAFIDAVWIEKSRQFQYLADFKGAIDSAAKAQIFFYKSTTSPRQQLLRTWYDAIEHNADDLATILCYDNGKTFAESKAKIHYASSFNHWFSEEASRTYGDTIPSSQEDTIMMTFTEPVGVCGFITLWNFPAAMMTRKAGPALATGCSVVVKPPSETPHTCFALVKLAIDRPFGIFGVGTKPQSRKARFTGSTGVGKMLAELAAKTPKGESLELGGNAPFIVFNDADIELAVEGAMICKFRCTGQACVRYVERAVSMKGRFRQSPCQPTYGPRRNCPEVYGCAGTGVEQLQMGLGIEAATTQGPLVIATRSAKRRSMYKMLLQNGCVETGGFRPDRPGFFYAPTVVSGVTRDKKVASQETFGPLAPIVTFKTEEEAVQLANVTKFGLAGYFFCRNVGRVLRGASRAVQDVRCQHRSYQCVRNPFGGIKESRYGREGSKYGMDEDHQIFKPITIRNTQA
ncbi:Aldehyde/histidinol dehydrogenase [Aspergillus alliaceus]|uniref:Aldehyde/histidinol dehydrogenase n=1 Tax=Petromyces alliaceus TaxID=209559 RepID=UPI0012A54028|nr:Aldehyde/histidinol dehydrogenase [Aspergillus alliaceus]KAB8228887.1 Aldehyde/histidinol dehydrogenase [Aspergillus alliaceus]